MPIKIYVVSLARAHNRRKFMDKQLRKQGLDFQFIDAHDARDITDNELKKLNDNRIYGQNLTRGEVACAMSHAKACKTLAHEQTYSHGLIIEDDVILSSYLPTILYALQRRNALEDVILLYSCIFKPIALSKCEDLTQGYSLVKASDINRVYGTQAYFISKEKAASFASNITPVRTIADDWALYIARGYFSNLKLVYPFPALHAEFLSAVNEKQYKHIGVRTKLKDFIYSNQIPPFYQLFLSHRRRLAEKIQRKNISSPEFPGKKTFKL